MAIDFPNSPSIDDVFAVGTDEEIRFFQYAGSLIWKRFASYSFIYDGKTPSGAVAATLDGGQA